MWIGLPAELAGQLDRPVPALEVAVRIPAADHLLVVALVASGTVGEEAATLARPGEVRDLPCVQPRLPLVVGGGHAARPDRIEHFGQREVVGKGGRRCLAVLRRHRLIGLVHTLARPVRAAEDAADAAAP